MGLDTSVGCYWGFLLYEDPKFEEEDFESNSEEDYENEDLIPDGWYLHEDKYNGYGVRILHYADLSQSEGWKSSGTGGVGVKFEIPKPDAVTKEIRKEAKHVRKLLIEKIGKDNFQGPGWFLFACGT